MGEYSFNGNMPTFNGIPMIGGTPLGVGTGQVFYLCADTSDYYFDKLKRASRGRVFTTLTAAKAQMVSDRGDILFVFPGDHVQTASTTWDLNNSAIVGVGSPNQRHQPSTLTSGAVRLTCKTAAVNQVLNITGKYVQLWDIGTINTAASTSNLTDVVFAGRNPLAVRCAFRGGNDATQVQNALAGIPVTISTDAYGFKFVECEFGSAGNTTRTTGPGFIRFAAGAGGAGLFKDCAFSMRSETNGTNPKGFSIEEAALDRLTTFKDCTFYNFSENWGALPDYMFHIAQTTTYDILLMRCAMVGFDTVTDVTAHLKTSDATCSATGIEAVAVTA